MPSECQVASIHDDWNSKTQLSLWRVQLHIKINHNCMLGCVNRLVICQQCLRVQRLQPVFRLRLAPCMFV